MGLQNARFILAKFIRKLPFHLGLSSVWPRTYLGYVPDRYGQNNKIYLKRGGQFGNRFREEFFRGNGLNNRGDLQRYFFLSMIFDQFIKEDVAGDLAELGVYKGNSAVMLAELARLKNRTVYLLDTFSGFAEQDLTGVDAGTAKVFQDTSLELVRAFVGEKNVRYIQGFFPETAPQLPGEATYGLVHIDCDLYAPFVAALEYFYPRLVKGGFLIMHDYSSLNWDGAEKAVDEFFADKPEKIVPIADKSGTVVIRKV